MGSGFEPHKPGFMDRVDTVDEVEEHGQTWTAY